jgi:hypothetical protein
LQKRWYADQSHPGVLRSQQRQDTMIFLLLNGLFVLVGLWLAGYTHWRLRAHTATRTQAELTRLLLVVAGMAVGWAATAWQPTIEGTVAVLRFLLGFGWLHLPAAFILWSKHQRGVYR